MATQNEAGAATRTVWQLDPNHTLVQFTGKHMMITTVRGHFKGVRGTIILDEADPSRSWVEVEVDAASLYSGVEYRDNHLKSADFLEVEKYPTITFKSTRVVPEGSDSARIIGDLTIHGVTREVVLDTELTGRGKNPMSQEVVAFDAKTSINRKDFGLSWNMALESCGLLRLASCFATGLQPTAANLLCIFFLLLLLFLLLRCHQHLDGLLGIHRHLLCYFGYLLHRQLGHHFLLRFLSLAQALTRIACYRL